MKDIFSSNYKGDKSQIRKIILNFESEGIAFDDRKRNSLKLFEVDGKTINVKSFKIPNFINKIAYRYFRTSKARRSFEYANRLLDNDVLTPMPIAYFEEKGFFFGKSYYVSEHLTYDLTYRELIEDSPYAGNQEILAAFARFTYQLHQKGIHFLDHSPGNTLIKINSDGSYDFYLVDLNRMEFGPMSFKTRMENFNRLSKIEDQVRITANAYAAASNENATTVFKAMWQATLEFRRQFHKKKALKNTLKFWK